jgi:hypothetical protein
MSIATCLWKFVAALNSTPISSIGICVLLLLRRMGQAMSIATCLWKLITALNSTPRVYAAAASITFQDHPLLRRSQQMLSNSEVDTTPLVAHCVGPIFCHFFSMERFTIKTIPVSCSRTSTTHWVVDKNHTIRFRDKHACVAIVKFIPFDHHMMCDCGLAGDVFWLIIRSRCGMTRVALTAVMHSSTASLLRRVFMGSGAEGMSTPTPSINAIK